MYIVLAQSWAILMAGIFLISKSLCLCVCPRGHCKRWIVVGIVSYLQQYLGNNIIVGQDSLLQKIFQFHILFTPWVCQWPLIRYKHVYLPSPNKADIIEVFILLNM